MYYPNLIPSLIEALDNGIGEANAFSMDDLKDARNDGAFGQVVWEACRYLWTCHLSHEADGGEVPAEPALRLDFIMRQCTYAEKGTVMQKSMDLEFGCELEEPHRLLQPTAHRLWTQRAELDWGDDDDHDAAMTDWHSDLERDRKLTPAGESGAWKLDGDAIIVSPKVEAGAAATLKPYCLAHWAAHPDRSDIYPLTAFRYATEVEARDALKAVVKAGNLDVACFTLNGPGVYGVYKARAEDDAHDADMAGWYQDFQRDSKLMAAADEQEAQAALPEVTEEARLAGMAGGCAAHNEAMEQSLESYEDGPIDGYDY
jgi:hypothetical protein